MLTIIVDNVHDLTGMKSKFCVNASESLNPLVFPQRSGRQKAQAANEELRVEEEASSLPLPFFLGGRDSHEIRSGAEEEEDNNAVRASVRCVRSRGSRSLPPATRRNRYGNQTAYFPFPHSFPSLRGFDHCVAIARRPE